MGGAAAGTPERHREVPLIVVAVSILAAAVGILVTRALVDRTLPRLADVDPHAPWALGVAALAPAWLIVFVSLLPTGARPAMASGVAWITSAAAALAGAIASESRLRQAGSAESLPLRACWRRGLVVLAPAWAISIVGRLVSAAT